MLGGTRKAIRQLAIEDADWEVKRTGIHFVADLWLGCHRDSLQGVIDSHEVAILLQGDEILFESVS